MTTYLKKAIERAVKGGWKPKGYEHINLSSPKTIEVLIISAGWGNLTSDPKFWQALGKAEGWGIEPSGSIWQGKEQWIIYGHDFLDHIFALKDPESFFASLLKTKE